jgi:hypothetical protein
MKLELNDIYLIFGPSKDKLSNSSDFSNDPKSCFYDINDQLTNIVMMHEIVEEKRKPERMDELKKKMEEKIKRKNERAKKRQEIMRKRAADEEMKRVAPSAWAQEQKRRQEKKEAKEFKEPPLLGLLTRLFRGVKFDIKNIHIRYEDDLFTK